MGSTIIYENRAKEKPYIVEVALLTYQLVFNVLKVRKIIAHTRHDNEKVRSFNKRLGAQETGTIFLSGIEYITTELDKDEFASDKLEKILNHWKKRGGTT